MSAATPAVSTPDGASPTAANPPTADLPTANANDRLVLEYLRTRGYKDAEQALLANLDTSSDTSDKQPDTAPTTISAEELAKKLAVFAQKPSRPGENVLKETENDVISVEPTDREEGFQELEAWVDGSLDMYRPEFRPILFPVFCHFYLELIQLGYKEAALKFFSRFSPALAPVHSTTLHHLSTLLLPSHPPGFGLLIGWLTEVGFSGEKGRRGRTAVMRVVNNHLRVDVAPPSAHSISSSAWEESTGLMSSVIPQTKGGTPMTDPKAFNSLQGELKLGPAPISEELRAETDRVLRESAMINPDAQFDLILHGLRLQLVSCPPPFRLPPYPPSFKSTDVKREVEKVRDARKRIRLEPTTLSNALPGSGPKSRPLPVAPCCTFSQDTSLMATGFAESYIDWYRSDFQSTSIRDAGSLRKVREKGGSTTRKLIGHSGPVYSPPKFLLSASADGTARLWSMDTMTNVVAYRGHQNPIWDAQWSPMGVYFATASRDRTARLWSTDRTSTLRVFAGHNGDVDCLAFHPNSIYLATGSSDSSARLWDVQRGTCARVFIGHQGGISALTVSPDGRYLATAGEDLAINLWDLGSGQRVKKMTGHRSSIYSLAFSAETSTLVSGGADWTVRCWDVSSAGGPPGKPRENGTMLNGYGASGTSEENGSAKEDSTEATTDLLATFPTKRTPIINVQFTPRNLCLVAGPYLAPEQR
ncbi:TFIID and SAGA subunit [Amylocystis lapponica]|nr:TFIID and SAGA subunit [Amylocystis lapponica]